MLEEQTRDWTKRWRQEGLEAGRQQGIQEGRQQGIQEGRQQGIQEGRQQGIQEGIQEGRQEGEATLLTRQLDRRFGPLDEKIRQRIASADANTLLEWGDRILTAQHIGEVILDPN